MFIRRTNILPFTLRASGAESRKAGRWSGHFEEKDFPIGIGLVLSPCLSLSANLRKCSVVGWRVAVSLYLIVGYVDCFASGGGVAGVLPWVGARRPEGPLFCESDTVVFVSKDIYLGAIKCRSSTLLLNLDGLSI